MPRLELQLYEYQTQPLLEKLQGGEVDVGILALPVDLEGLEARELYTEPFIVAVPDQLIDYTHGRLTSFSDVDGAKVEHIDFSEPYSASLRTA